MEKTREGHEPRFQSSIGTVYERRYKEGSNIDRISFARVTKVNYRYNTVDVRSVGGDYNISTSGKLSAQLPVQFGGTTIDGKPYGQVNPIEVGTYVLIGFVGGKKTSPIVLAIYNDFEESERLSRTPFDEADPEDEELKELSQQQFTVYPSLTYKNIDGVGNRTVSFTGKSFVATEAGANPEVGGLTDDVDGTQYEELASSYYYTGELIEPKENKAPVILFRHQGDKFAHNEEGFEEGNHSFMWFLDDDGTHRASIMKEDEDWRTFFEMTPEGKIQLVRQNDSKKINSTSNRYSIGVEKDGIRIQVGNKYQLITPEGTYGNLGGGSGGTGGGLGGGIGGGGGTIPDDLLKDIEDKLDLANRKIIEMDTYIKQTEGFISMGANMIEKIEDEMAVYESNFTVLAEEIRTSVSETRIRDLLNEELDIFINDIEEINREAKEHLETISNLVEDGKLTPSEKEILAPIYIGIKVEYPSYVEQAEKNGKDTSNIKKAYNKLVKNMDPVMSSLGETTNVDPVLVVRLFQDYYNARQQLLSGILYSIQKEVVELADETSKVARDATKALSDSGIALEEAKRALGNLQNIADSNQITPSEKTTLQRDLRRIQNEYNDYVIQAEQFEIDSTMYTNAYNSLINFVDNSNMFSNMSETTPVDGQRLYDLMEEYFKERIKILTQIAKISSEQLKNLHINFEHHQTQIVETSKEIALIAESVVATEQSVSVAMARLSIMSDRISTTVTDATFKREIDANRNTLNATGRNLHVNTTTTKGVIINPSDGTTSPLTGASSSAYINVNSGVLYTASLHNIKGTNSLTVAYYNANQEHISSGTKAVSSGDSFVELPIMAPEGAKYARVSVDNFSTADVQFERGTSTKFYMYSNEDLLNNLEAATEEKLNREIAWKDKNTTRIEKSEDRARIVSNVSDIMLNSVLTKEDAQYLANEVSNLEADHKALVIEANELDIQTINTEMAMSSLKTVEELYITPAIVNDGTTLSEAERNQIEIRFKDYADRSNSLYKQIDEKFKASYEASVEVLDEVMAGSLEAERIARETAIAAEKAAQNVSSLEIQIAEGNQMESRHISKVRDISADSVLTPVEKEHGVTIMREIKDEITWLIAQGRSVGMSTNDLENAFNTLEAYFSSFVTPEKMLDSTPINKQTFENNFQSYHTSKGTFLANLLLEAKAEAEKKDEEAKLARNETLRRDEEYQRVKNIITDSEIAIERIEQKIETIENTNAFSVEVLSTNGFTFKDRIIDTTLKVTVRRGVEDITAEIPNVNFEWSKTKANGEIDIEWGRIHEGIGPEVQLNHEDIQGKATFTVEVYLDEVGGN